VRDGSAYGVALTSGEEFTASKIASGVDPHLTFEKLLDPGQLPPEFAAAIHRIDYSSASLKINVALTEPPNWSACPSPAGGTGPQHHGTMHIVPDQDYIERAYDDAKFGIPSRDPVLECTLPSSVDPSVAPPGQHLMSMFIQYAPYHLKEGTWDEATKNRFADRCFDLMNEYAPNFKKSVIARQVLTPVDLEKVFNLTGGNLFHGVMSLDRLFMLRPVVGYADYRTPIRHLYLCGSAAHPGGGVMGIAGQNAAREMQKRW
jgi:phytoene dehydrogenase-like protein